MAKTTSQVVKEIAETLSDYEFLSVDPTTIVVDKSRRGRVRKEPTEDEIDTLAKSIHNEGQLQPVQCIRDDQGQLVLNFGYTRHAAILKLHGQNAKTRIDVLVPKKTPKPEDVLLQNLSENIQRKNTSNLDDALNQEELRVNHKWSNARIATFYNQDAATVSRLAKLLTFPQEIKDEVHDGRLGLMGCEVLHGIPEQHRLDVLVRAKNELEPKDDKFLTRSVLKRVWAELKAALEESENRNESVTQNEDGQSAGDFVGDSPTAREPTNADKMDRASIIAHFKAEANRGQWVKSQGGGEFNQKRADLHGAYLEFFEGSALWDSVDAILSETFPHSDQDVAMLPEPTPEDKPKSRRGRPKKVKEESQEVGSYNFGGLIGQGEKTEEIDDRDINEFVTT